MQRFQGKQNVGCVEAGSVLLEPADLAQVEEQFTTRTVLETEE